MAEIVFGIVGVVAPIVTFTTKVCDRFEKIRELLMYIEKPESLENLKSEIYLVKRGLNAIRNVKSLTKGKKNKLYEKSMGYLEEYERLLSKVKRMLEKFPNAPQNDRIKILTNLEHILQESIPNVKIQVHTWLQGVSLQLNSENNFYVQSTRNEVIQQGKKIEQIARLAKKQSEDIAEIKTIVMNTRGQLPATRAPDSPARQLIKPQQLVEIPGQFRKEIAEETVHQSDGPLINSMKRCWTTAPAITQNSRSRSHCFSPGKPLLVEKSSPIVVTVSSTKPVVCRDQEIFIGKMKIDVPAPAWEVNSKKVSSLVQIPEELKTVLSLIRQRDGENAARSCLTIHDGWFPKSDTCELLQIEEEDESTSRYSERLSRDDVITLGISLPEHIRDWLLAIFRDEAQTSLHTQSMIRKVHILLSPINLIKPLRLFQDMSNEKPEVLFHWKICQGCTGYDVRSRLLDLARLREQIEQQSELIVPQVGNIALCLTIPWQKYKAWAQGAEENEALTTLWAFGILVTIPAEIKKGPQEELVEGIWCSEKIYTTTCTSGLPRTVAGCIQEYQFPDMPTSSGVVPGRIAPNRIIVAIFKNEREQELVDKVRSFLQMDQDRGPYELGPYGMGIELDALKRHYLKKSC